MKCPEGGPRENGGGRTLAARSVISSTISFPSSSTCGLKMVCVARRAGDVLKARRSAGCGVFAAGKGEAVGIVRRGAGRMGICLAAACIPRHRAGMRRSRIGAEAEAAWRRMLSRMKREAVEGGLRQGRGGILIGTRL